MAGARRASPSVYCVLAPVARGGGSHPSAALSRTLSLQVQHVGAGGKHPGRPTVRRLRGEVRRFRQLGTTEEEINKKKQKPNNNTNT